MSSVKNLQILLMSCCILLSFSFTLLGRESNKEFILYKPEIKTKQTESSNIYNSKFYLEESGNVLDINDLGVVKCLLINNTSAGLKRRICHVKLAGIKYKKEKIRNAVTRLKKILIGKKIKVIASPSEEFLVHNNSKFEGLVMFNKYSINYSLLRNGFAEFNKGTYLGHFPISVYEEAVMIYKKSNQRN